MINLKRKMTLLITVLAFAGCDASTAASNEVGSKSLDERYVLVAHGLPTLTYGTAKSCHRIIKLGDKEIKNSPGVVGEVFGQHMEPFWRYMVEHGSQTEAPKTAILSSGWFSKDEGEPEFSLTGGLIKKSEDCGFITGQAFVTSGLTTVEQVIEMSEVGTEDGFSNNELAGMVLMESAAEYISINYPNKALDCLSSLTASLHSTDDNFEMADDELDMHRMIWGAVVADGVNRQRYDPTKFSEVSSEFKQLAAFKRDGDKLTDTFNVELRDECASLSTDAVVKASEEAQQ